MKQVTKWFGSMDAPNYDEPNSSCIVYGGTRLLEYLYLFIYLFIYLSIYLFIYLSTYN